MIYDDRRPPGYVNRREHPLRSGRRNNAFTFISFRSVRSVCRSRRRRRRRLLRNSYTMNAEQRREARRKRILENSESRLRKITTLTVGDTAPSGDTVPANDTAPFSDPDGPEKRNPAGNTLCDRRYRSDPSRTVKSFLQRPQTFHSESPAVRTVLSPVHTKKTLSYTCVGDILAHNIFVSPLSPKTKIL